MCQLQHGLTNRRRILTVNQINSMRNRFITERTKHGIVPKAYEIIVKVEFRLLFPSNVSNTSHFPILRYYEVVVPYHLELFLTATAVALV